MPASCKIVFTNGREVHRADDCLPLTRAENALLLELFASNPIYFSPALTDASRSVRLFMEELRLRGETVSEIAHQVGFPHANYFSRVFVQRYGCTPADWRIRSEN